MKRTFRSEYFYGNRVSEYGLQNNRVDYGTLARAFDAVLNNNIMERTMDIGYWDIESGLGEYYEDYGGNEYSYQEAQERIEELDAELENLPEDSEAREEIERDIESLNDPRYVEVYQYYIVSDRGAEILERWTDDPVWYNEELDMYVWGVTHFGTSWDYVLTDICIEKD